LGGIAATLGLGATGSQVALRMLAAAAHRGAMAETVQVRDIVLGIANDATFIDTTLAAADGWGAAVQGPLDNLDELSEALAAAGHIFMSRPSPAACVLTAFRTWGERTWSRLRGDVAVVITDGSRLWASRDQLGAATLFARNRPPVLLIASEAKQVIAGAGVAREPDLDGISRLFFGGEDAFDEPPCAIKGVERIPRSSVVEYSPEHSPRTTRYWNPSRLVASSKLSPSEVREELTRHLESAVERMTPPGTVVALSGGIDSPAIAAFAAPVERKRGSRLRALSTVYPNAPSVDESPYIEAIVKQLDLDWHSFAPEHHQLDGLQSWVDRFDGPVPNLDTAAVAEFFDHARGLSARTVLFGELAELTIDLRAHLEGHLLLSGHWRTAGRLLAAKHARGVGWPTVIRGVLPTIAPARLATWYVRRRGLERDRLAPWIDPAFVPGLDVRWDLARPARRRWTDIQAYFPMAPSNIGIEATSIVAASLGVHMRRPFTDVDLWEFLLGLPAHRKYPEPLSKSIIRNALRGRIPDVVLDRRDKTGFDEDVRQRVDAPGLRRWILGTDFRMKGIRYKVIERMTEQDTLDIWNLNALRYLAAIHAFVDLFR
jgi:asparagine synthase (glutamine-hydrolysing)